MIPSSLAWSLNWGGAIMACGLLLVVNLAVIVRRGPVFVGRDELTFALGAAGWWMFAAGMEMLMIHPDAKMFWAEAAWPGIVAAPAGWTRFIMVYCDGSRFRVSSKSYFVAMIALSLAVLAFALTNDFHRLIYERARPISDAPGAALVYDHGLGFVCLEGFVYATVIVAAVILSDTVRRAPPRLRPHFFGLLLTTVLEMFVGVSYMSGHLTIFDFDPTPFSFILMSIVIYVMVSRRTLISYLPVVHRALLDALPDAVFVLDGDGLVIEANAAGEGILAGRDRLWFPGLGTEAFDEAAAGEGAPVAIADVEGAPTHVVRVRPLERGGRTLGYAVVLTDISQRLALERRLEEQLAANVRLQSRLRDLAERDPLTDLRNRRSLEAARERFFSDARDAGRPLSVALIDLDRFKSTNDEFGHQVGDEILRRFAEELRRTFTDDDRVFRVGGEEFLILMPDATVAAARNSMEAFRERMAAMPGVVAPGNREVRATFSAGVGEYPIDGREWRELYRNVDVALYRAKGLGRDRVCAVRETDRTGGE